MAHATEASTQGKAKTTAKKRYLRRKKDRRKLRTKHQAGLDGAGDGPQESITFNEDPGHEGHSEDTLLTQHVESSPSRPAKRRKVVKEPKKDTMPAVKEIPSLENINADIQMEEDILVPLPKRRSSTPPPLPIFPLPVLPNAPSKNALVLQGLDKAMADAEIVDPDLVLPIPPEGIDDGGTRLSERMRKRLHESGISELFAVQTSLLPFLIPDSFVQRQLYTSTQPTRDVCVSAPTGSGKTLVYVLPIIEILASRIVTQLRALVVLPTKDLVTQVREVFEVLGKGRGLKIGIATGQHSFAHEQARLVGSQAPNLLGGTSKVDILICTPGRLIDHLNGTPNFTLQHLRFLVIDEADRLLAQSFQDWLAQVLAAIRSPTINKNSPDPQDGFCPYPDPVAPNMLHRLPYPHLPTFLTEERESSCQKLLFSATLTRDPGKIAILGLREPKYFIVQKRKDFSAQNSILDVVVERFSMPSTLQERMVICESSQKPLMFLHLIFDKNVTEALVFTKSAESTTRLVRLFDFFQEWRKTASEKLPLVVRAYSSDLPVGERKAILERFKAQDINILICSDLVSRGIDINHVSHVVSYDAPVDMRKYVHRVGRTARAGRAGFAWTLVEEQEARYFKNMLKDAGHSEQVKRLRVAEKELTALTPGYEVALKQLKEVYTRPR